MLPPVTTLSSSPRRREIASAPAPRLAVMGQSPPATGSTKPPAETSTTSVSALALPVTVICAMLASVAAPQFAAVLVPTANVTAVPSFESVTVPSPAAKVRTAVPPPPALRTQVAACARGAARTAPRTPRTAARKARRRILRMEMSPSLGFVGEPTGARGRGASSASGEIAEESAVALDQPAIRVDLAAVAQIAHEIPVQRALVEPAGDRVRGTQRHGHRAADLLVQERVQCRLPDRLVQPERELAEHPGALVGVDRGPQERLPGVGLRLDAAARLEAQARAFDALATPGRRHRERHDALGGRLVRAGEDLAVGQVVSSAGADPAPAADAHPEVGALGHDAQFVDCFELPHEPVLQVALGSPGHDGIGLIELERAPEQLAVGVQREPGRLRIGGGRVLGAAPHRLTARVAVDEHVRGAQSRRLGGCGSRRLDVCQLLDVRKREQRHASIDALVPDQLEVVGLRQDLLAGALRLGLDPSVRQHLQVRMPTRLEHAAMHRAKQRFRELAALDQHALARLDGKRVLDDHARVEIVEGIHQTCSLPSTRTASPSASMRPPARRSRTRSQWIAETLSPPSSGNERPSARWHVPPIFSSKSVSPTARVIISFVPIANSPTLRAPSSVSSRESRTSSPTDADASTTTLASKRRRTSRHVRRSSIEGTSNVISPWTAPAGGQQKTSPSGRFISPAQDSQARPSMFTRRSVPGPVIRSSLAAASRSIRRALRSPRARQGATGSGSSSSSAAYTKRSQAAVPMRAVWAPSAVGKPAPSQVSSPAASRSECRSKSGRRARAMAASRALAMPESSAVLPGAQMNSQRSKRSTSSRVAGSR